MKKLFTCLTGSALFGTRTPTSDRDIKHLVLPDLDHLLLGKKVVNVAKHTNKKENVRNTVDDVDEEFIPLQIFARDFMMGQTYALEMAFALKGSHAEQKFYHNDRPLEGTMYTVRDRNFEENDHYEVPIILFVDQLKSRFLTSDIKAMMGYVVNQASLYSFKGERLNAARDFKDVLEVYLEGHAEKSLGDLWDAVQHNMFSAWLKALNIKHPKYFRISEYDIGGGRMKPCFILLEKTIPFTTKLGHALTIVNSVIKKYGSRADQASASNVDWKATMHALRIVDEGLMLLTKKELHFPFPSDQVEKYLSIKRGERDLTAVTEELTSKLDQLKTLEKETNLPAYSQEMQQNFDIWLAGWMRFFYDITP